MVRGVRPVPQPVAGRRVLITGGSSGIGLACARELTAGGARVALLARGEEGLREAAASMAPEPATIAADVTDPDAVHAAVDDAARLLGGLDVVVSNAAAAAYAAAKHGVRGFVRSLSAELRALGSPVRVALIAPGPVDTPFWQRARTVDRRLPPRIFGVYTPEDVAREVTRAIGSPRTERTVGGLTAAVAFADAVAPNATLPVLGRLAKAGWRKRGSRPLEPSDALIEPTARARLRTRALPSRPSVLVRLRDLARLGR